MLFCGLIIEGVSERAHTCEFLWCCNQLLHKNTTFKQFPPGLKWKPSTCSRVFHWKFNGFLPGITMLIGQKFQKVLWILIDRNLETHLFSTTTALTFSIGLSIKDFTLVKEDLLKTPSVWTLLSYSRSSDFF